MIIVDSREIIEKDDYDVIVVGGGMAGVSAAVASAREGAKTLLIEKSIILGGLGTAGLISWYEPLCDGAGKKMISGIAEELIKLSYKYGFDDLPDSWRDGIEKTEMQGRYATHYSPTIFAMVLDQYLVDNNVTFLLDMLATFPIMEKGHCKGIVVETVEGKLFYGAKVVIDATGDASVFHKAGAPTVLGENFLTYVTHYTDLELAQDFANTNNMAKFRKWNLVGSNMSGAGHPEGMKKFRGDTADEITEFVVTGRKYFFEKIKNDDRCSRDVTMLPVMPQFRTIRRIVGEYEFSGKELDVKFEHSIGSMGDFRSRGKHYQLPYECLYNKNYDNLLAAGRIISASGDGWEITRVIPVAVLSGEAAGTAAAMAVNNCAVYNVDIKSLQNKLSQNGVMFV